MSGNGNDIVISGIGGKFPEANNVLQLQEKLFSKQDLVTDELRWTKDTLGVGKIADVDTFDASPFKMHNKLVRSTDPNTTQTLERAFESIIDAGINPVSLSGRNIAVISASMISDSENTRAGTSYDSSGFSIMGHNRSMVANRISYTFNFRGPSYSIHTSWAGGVDALKQGSWMITQGLAEAAVVTTATLVFFRAAGIEYDHMHMHSPGVRCRSFDDQANGTCRSEGVVSFFLQRARDAKRNYATLVSAYSDCLGQRKCSLIHFDSLISTSLRQFYENNGVDPEDIAYLEADGSGFKAFDTIELNALASVFFGKRKKPLHIGSVKSNVGNTEVASSFLGLTKSIIAMETGIIPPNINYSSPNRNVPALMSGQFKPVTEETQLTGDLVSVSSMSLGGTAGHVIIRRNTKEKKHLDKGELPPDGLHRLIMLSARHEEGITDISNKLQSMPVDIEYASLVNDVFKSNLPGYLWKSFVVVPPADEEIKLNVKKFDNIKQPIWFVFSGMGSQWAGMGKDLLHFPLFAAAVDKCDAVLRPRGLDIRQILTTDDNSTFDNILNCFVGIAAVQIGLVDMLHSAGLEPDGMVGHSVGELGCAYADGCFTAEEMVLAAYARGKASLESEVIGGMMAAIGLGYKDMRSRVPASIDVACHNAADSCTLSGPTDDVIEYVKKLKEENIFAKAVSAGNIAYHSRYIEPVAPKLFQYLAETIKNPKARSSRWISSSVPEENWTTAAAQLSSAEYHTNNLLSPVLFEEACRHIPKDAIVIEIAPHGLLQAILRRSLSAGCVNVPLTNKNATSSVRFLLEAFGTMYLHNVSVDVNKLYPPVEYPVSRGTPYIAPLLTWNHHDHWFNEFQDMLQLLTYTNEIKINMAETFKDFSLWEEHCIDGNLVFPTSLILVYAWDLLFLMGPLESEKEAILIEDMIISKQITLKRSKFQQLIFTKRRCTGNFGINLCEDGVESDVIVTGKLQHISEPPATLQQEDAEQKNEQDGVSVTKEEILEVLSYFKYELGPQFQTFRGVKISSSGFTGKVVWTGNMVTFLDSLFKLILFMELEKARVFLYPSYLKSLILDAPYFFKLDKGTEVDVYYDSRNNNLRCKGLQLVGVSFSADPLCVDKPLPLQWTQQSFVPFHTEELKLSAFIAASLQLLVESGLSKWQKEDVEVSVLEIEESNGTSALVSKAIKEASLTFPHIHVKLKVMDIQQIKEELFFKQNKIYLVVGSYVKAAQLMGVTPDNVLLIAHVCGSQNLTNGHQILSNGAQGLSDDIFTLGNVLSKEVSASDFCAMKSILTCHIKKGEKLVLLKKRVKVQQLRVLHLKDAKGLTDLGHLFNGCDNGQPVLVVSRDWEPAQVLPLLAAQKYAHRLRCIFLDKMAPEFSISSPLYYNHLSLGLSVSHLSRKVWGFNCSLDVNLDQNILGTITSPHSTLDVNIIALNSTTMLDKPDDPAAEEIDVRYVDYCGSRSSGEKVMGLASFDPTTNHVTPDQTLVWPLPPGWHMEEGSTVPAAYSLAYYCFYIKTELMPGMKVLVHAGACPVSQACISVALEGGADLFITVHSEEQCSSLLHTFPQIKQDHLLLIDSFHVALKRRNIKVKLIINCLKNTETELSMKCVDDSAHFINLRSAGVRDREFIGMFDFLYNLSFHGVSLASLFNSDVDTKTKLQLYLKDGMEKGVVKPLKRHLFTMEEYEQAIRHLKLHSFDEKTLIVVKRPSNSQSTLSNHSFNCDPLEAYIIVATDAVLCLDVMEWLVTRGARKLLVAVDKQSLTYISSRRLDKLMARHYLNIKVGSFGCLNSSNGALNFISEAKRMGPVSTVFCVSMEENSAAVAHLDSAARLLVPQLRQFVCLLGGSASVCESRAQEGLSACLIQSETPLARPQVVLPYLASILTDCNSIGHIYKVGQAGLLLSSQDGGKYVTQDPQSLLPSSIPDLLKLANEVTEGPTVHEVVTRSLLHKDVKYCLLPVFVIPGVRSGCIKQFMRKLMHPTYCVSLPIHQKSISSTAEALLQEVLRVQSRGPYNVVAESWSGGLALQLGVLLEARGHKVELFLLDAAPPTLQHCARSLSSTGTEARSFNANLLTTMLNLDSQKSRQLHELQCWEEQLEKSLHLMQLQSSQAASMEVTQSLRKAVVAVWSHLNTLLQFTPPQELFKGLVHLIRPKGASEMDFCGLSQVYCQQKPTIHVLENECHSAMVKDDACVNIVNENLLFTWEL